MSQPRQQVNLYQHTVPAWRPFGSATLALAAGAVSGCLILIWAFGSWQVARLQSSVDALQRQQAAQQTALSALGALQGNVGNAADLQARIQQLSSELATRERALALLQGGAVGGTKGFSAQLVALARHPMTGLWLRQITLSDLTGSMSLAGEALDPDRVPRYLHALASEPVLAGLRFDRLVIERPGAPELGPGAPSAASPGATAHGHPLHPATFKFHADGTPAPDQVAAATTQAPQS